MNNSFPIFEKMGRIIKPTKGNILFSIMLVFVFLDKIFNKSPNFLIFPTAILMIGNLIYLFTGCFRYKYLDGKFIGVLTFNQTHLLIDARKIEIAEFEKIYLRTDDYLGKSHISGRCINPMSNGTNNLLSLTLKSGESIKLFFQIEFMQHEDLKPFIISLINANLMTFDDGLETLKLEDDYQINLFKIELNNKKS